MPVIENLEANPAAKPAAHAEPVAAGHQRLGRLWSSLSDVCALLRIDLPPARLDDQLRLQHVQVRAGQRAFTLGQEFDALYIVNSGFIKTVLIDEAGNEQVLSFPMKGDLLGVDGLQVRKYESEAVALSDCDLISIPFKTMLSLDRKNTVMEEMMYDVISRELASKHKMVRMLAALSADARIACFLISLAERHAMMGYSGKEFMLRMTRQDIGRYLGVTLETVTRAFSAFKEAGLIGVDQRFICIKDKKTLESLCSWTPRTRVIAKGVFAPKNHAMSAAF